MTPLPRADDPRVLAPGQAMSAARSAWRWPQRVVWLAGAGLVLALALAPEIGLHALWNVLIPAAPLLLVVFPGVWRNVCPLGTTALLPRRLGLSRQRALSSRWQARLVLIGVLALLLLAPLRHVALDASGPATALLLVLLAAAATAMGLLCAGKSGWCSGPCPVHAVETLYGQSPLWTPANAHCSACTHCVQPCPESIPGGHPLSSCALPSRALAGTLLVGGFPGFVWGWFQVPDYAVDGWRHAGTAYAWPFAGLAVTLAAFLALRALLPRREGVLVRAFAAAAVACYYWFRLPALAGFGPFPGDGMLVDLTGVLPSWAPYVSQAVTTVLLAALLLSPTAGAGEAGPRGPPSRRAPSACPRQVDHAGGEERAGDEGDLGACRVVRGPDGRAHPRQRREGRDAGCAPARTARSTACSNSSESGFPVQATWPSRPMTTACGIPSTL